MGCLLTSTFGLRVWIRLCGDDVAAPDPRRRLSLKVRCILLNKAPNTYAP